MAVDTVPEPVTAETRVPLVAVVVWYVGAAVALLFRFQKKYPTPTMTMRMIKVRIQWVRNEERNDFIYQFNCTQVSLYCLPLF